MHGTSEISCDPGQTLKTSWESLVPNCMCSSLFPLLVVRVSSFYIHVVLFPLIIVRVSSLQKYSQDCIYIFSLLYSATLDCHYCLWMIDEWFSYCHQVTLQPQVYIPYTAECMMSLHELPSLTLPKVICVSSKCWPFWTI